MEGQNWRPLFVRDSNEQTKYDVLYEGIPDWLQGSIWRWLADRAAEGGQPMINRLERRLHQALTGAGGRPMGGQHNPPSKLLNNYWQANTDRDRLVLLDAILYDLQVRARNDIDSDNHERHERLVEAAQRLGTYLVEGGSLWTAHVAPPTWGLVRRVDETTAELVDVITFPSTDAARKIRAAWHACYRHGPDPNTAYRDAVLAVEAVVFPVTIRNDAKATLGKAISHIRDTLSQWSVGGLNTDQSAETLLAMMETLWQNQQRHARQGGEIVDVSQPEAEAAVGLAVLLVHWFTTGLVTKADLA